MSSSIKEPSAWQIEQTVSAHQRIRAKLSGDRYLIADEASIFAALDGDPVKTPTELLDRMLNAYAWTIRRALEADGLKRAFAQRQKRYEGRALFLHELVRDFMIAVEINSRSAALARVSLRNVPGSLLVTDEDAVPLRFKTEEITYKLDRKALTEALVDGEAIEGAVMSNASQQAWIVPVKSADEQEEDANA